MPPKILSKSIKHFKGMNSADDTTSLEEGKFILIQNMTIENGALVTREGITKFVTSTVRAGCAVQGLETVTLPEGQFWDFAVAGGYLAYSYGGWTIVSAGLGASYQAKIAQFDDKVIALAQTTKPLVYSTTTSLAFFSGIPSPKEFKLIEDFEITFGRWTVTNGTAVESYSHAVYGLSASKFTSIGATTMTISRALDIFVDCTTGGVFPDGSVSTDDDFISIFCIRGNPQKITSCEIRLYSSPTDYYSANLEKCYEWYNNPSSYAGLTLRIRKSSFNVGSGTPTWMITNIGFVIVTSDSQSLIFDFLRMEKGAPVPHIYGKTIADFNGIEGWVADVGTLPSIDTKYAVSGSDFEITGDKSFHKLFSPPNLLNLETFDDGVAASDIDDIEVNLLRSGGNGTVTLVFYNSYGVWGAAGTVAASKVFTPSTGKAMKKHRQTKVTGWTVCGGFDLASSWNSIERVDVLVGVVSWEATSATNAGQTIYIDELRLVQHENSITLAEFEDGEEWLVESPSSGASLTLCQTAGYYRSEEDSSASFLLLFASTAATSTTIKYTFPTALDLSVYATSLTTQASDEMGLWVKIPVYKNIESIQLFVGPVGMATNYVKKIIEQDELVALEETPSTLHLNAWFDLHFAKSDWEEVGTMDWTNVGEVRITVSKASGTSGFRCYLDKWTLARRQKLSGIFQYMVTFVSNYGEESDPSLTSDPIVDRGASIYLTGIPAFGSTKVGSRKIYRIGGTQSEWRLVDVIANNNQTTYTDNFLDSELGAPYVEKSGQPMIAKALTVADRKIIIGNLKDRDRTFFNYPSGVMVSEEGSVDIFDPINFFEVEQNSVEIKWLHYWNKHVFIGKEDSVWKFDPYNLAQKPSCESRIFGGVSLLSVCDGENEFYFLDKKGVVSYNGSHFDEHISDDVKNYFAGIEPTRFGQCWMKYWNEYLLVGFPYQDSTICNRILACWRPQKERFWFLIVDWEVNCAATFKSTQGNVIHFGGSRAANGYVWRGFYGDTDDGISITSILQTGDQDFDHPTVGKDYHQIQLVGKKESSANVTLTVEPYIDCVDSTKDLTLDNEGASVIMTSLTHNRWEIPGMQFSYFPTFLGIKITATKRWCLRRLTQFVRLLEEHL